MKRLLSCTASDFQAMRGKDLAHAIKASEGRTILAETVVTSPPLLEGLTNAEVMAAFGADIICLNEFDVFDKGINGLPAMDNPIAYLKELSGRPIGINLEPTEPNRANLETQINISAGRQASPETFQAAQALGVDFIMLTGNPATGVSNEAILNVVADAAKYYDGPVFAGKMHGAGLDEAVVNIEQLVAYVEEGADGVIIPAVGTVPGITLELAHEATQRVKAAGGLVMFTIGTSQESADQDTMRNIGLWNKQAGGDIHHIGDGGYGRMPIPENITALSLAVRGKRHTYTRMAQSIRR